MIGAICGDIVGSTREHHPITLTDFPLFEPRSRFTDDTVMTVAAASVLLGDATYVDAYRDFGRRYPHAGYGGGFRRWLTDADPKPYNSFGNGSAMRVSPVAWAKSSIDDVLAEAEVIRIRPASNGRSDSPGLPLRRDVPGLGARSDHRVPRLRRIRKRRAARRFARRG